MTTNQATRGGSPVTRSFPRIARIFGAGFLFSLACGGGGGGGGCGSGALDQCTRCFTGQSVYECDVATSNRFVCAGDDTQAFVACGGPFRDKVDCAKVLAKKGAASANPPGADEAGKDQGKGDEGASQPVVPTTSGGGQNSGSTGSG